MEVADHRLTASWGSSNVAKAHRAAQKEAIGAGRYDDAVMMDVLDIQDKFGSKYDDAILQMLDSL
jgi:filamentous hemagglutinin